MCQCSQALSHCTATEPIVERERGREKGSERCQLARWRPLSVCPALLCLELVCVCVSLYWQLKPLVCFSVCVCVYVCVRQKHKIQIKNKYIKKKCTNRKILAAYSLLIFYCAMFLLPTAQTHRGKQTHTHTHIPLHSGLPWREIDQPLLRL